MGSGPLGQLLCEFPSVVSPDSVGFYSFYENPWQSVLRVSSFMSWEGQPGPVSPAAVAVGFEMSSGPNWVLVLLMFLATVLDF